MCKQIEHQLRWCQQIKQDFERHTLVISAAMFIVVKSSVRREGGV